MYTDETMLSFGKYKFRRLTEVPAEYLINLYENKSYHNSELKEYIESNLEVIKKRIGRPKPIETVVPFICQKITYPTEAEAKFHLKNIKSKGGDNKKPYRAYECPYCSGWHLTSQESKKFAP